MSDDPPPHRDDPARGRFARRRRATPPPGSALDRARRDAANLRAELERLHRWATTIAGRGREAFEDPDDETLYLAAQAVIINLAEALDRRTPASVLDAVAPEVAGAVRGMRNRLAHDYLYLDKEIVWTTISRDLPDLVGRLLADGVLIHDRFLR